MTRPDQIPVSKLQSCPPVIQEIARTALDKHFTMVPYNLNGRRVAVVYCDGPRITEIIDWMLTQSIPRKNLKDMVRKEVLRALKRELAAAK